MKKVVVLQSNYIPWKGYFELIHEADTFCFYDEVQYTKNDWRNRNQLWNKQGKFWLTIPIQKEAVKQKISEVNLPEINWQKKHFRTIEQTYSHAPQKNSVLELLYPFYHDNNFETLSAYNQAMISEIARYIGIRTELVNSAQYELNGDRISRLLHLLKQLDTKVYLSGPSAKKYLQNETEAFEQENIELIYKKYGPYLSYGAATESKDDFISIIDLLMHVKAEDCLEYICSFDH